MLCFGLVQRAGLLWAVELSVIMNTFRKRLHSVDSWWSLRDKQQEKVLDVFCLSKFRTKVRVGKSIELKLHIFVIQVRRARQAFHRLWRGSKGWLGQDCCRQEPPREESDLPGTAGNCWFGLKHSAASYCGLVGKKNNVKTFGWTDLIWVVLPQGNCSWICVCDATNIYYNSNRWFFIHSKLNLAFLNITGCHIAKLILRSFIGISFSGCDCSEVTVVILFQSIADKSASFIKLCITNSSCFINMWKGWVRTSSQRESPKSCQSLCSESLSRDHLIYKCALLCTFSKSREGCFSCSVLRSYCCCSLYWHISVHAWSRSRSRSMLFQALYHLWTSVSSGLLEHFRNPTSYISTAHPKLNLLSLLRRPLEEQVTICSE